MEKLKKSVLAATLKKFDRVQQKEIELSGLQSQDKAEMRLHQSSVNIHFYTCTPP